jgi:hypothetical protein
VEGVLELADGPTWYAEVVKGDVHLPGTSVLRLRPACQRPACTRFHARADDWRFCVLRDSDRLVAKWRL